MKTLLITALFSLGIGFAKEASVTPNAPTVEEVRSQIQAINARWLHDMPATETAENNREFYLRMIGIPRLHLLGCRSTERGRCRYSKSTAEEAC